MRNDYKEFKELTIDDDFMFAKVMKNTDLCKQLLEVILKVKIDRIEYQEEQKTIDIVENAKGVRLDVYVLDEKPTVYNIEMQATVPKNLPKRSRYYQGMIDLNLIEKGANYNQLPQSYIIFICLADVFGKGRNIYTFKNVCIEDYSLQLNDCATKIFLNPDGDGKEIHPELKSFLQYLKNGTITDEFTGALHEEVKTVRANKKWRADYMTLYMKYNEIREEALEEGREEGRIQQAVESYEDIGMEANKIKDYLMKKFSLSEDEAEGYYNKYAVLPV